MTLRLILMALLATLPIAIQPPRETLVAPTAAVVFDGTTQVITQPLVYRNLVGQVIDGKNTKLVYRGGPTAGLIQLIGCSRCRVLDLELVVDTPSVVGAGVLITNGVVTDKTSTANEIKNVRVLHDGKPTAARRAFSVDPFAVGGTDGNNDLHHFEDCAAYSYRESAFYFVGTNTHDIHFLRCQAHDHGGRRPIGLHAAGAVFFCWQRGAMTNNSTDFKLDSPETQAVIEGHNSEHGTRFVVANHAGECNFRGQDVRWEGKPDPTLAVFEGNGTGPWHLSNSFFSGHNGVAPRFEFKGSTVYPSSLDLSGVMLRQHGGVQPILPLVTAPRGWEIRQHSLWWQKVGGTPDRIKKMIYVNKPVL